MSNSKIYTISPIKFYLGLKDPFISTMHHIDYYPAGDENLSPVHPAKNNEFQMYHGEIVPGFPSHPHTGFETITLVERGFVDHFDSLGNAGRYSAGDAQWVTTGNGIQHCEMFPLVNAEQDNTLELFQIWLNSSPEQKTQDADYKMLWREEIPQVNEDNSTDHATANVRIIAGEFKGQQSLERLPYSWAYAKENKLNIYLITLAAHAEIIIPASSTTATRFAYFYQGQTLVVEDTEVQFKHLLELKSDTDIHLQAGDQEARILWLEGEPIGAPVAAHGPFVLNSRAELETAFRRYQQTQFGGWPWPNEGPVFQRDMPRYASYEGGKREEYPDQN